MWSPLNAPYPYYADATQNSGAPYHYYQGSDNQAALMWALWGAANDPNHEPFVVPPGLAMTAPLSLPSATVEGLRIVSDKGGVLIPNALCAGKVVLNLTGCGDLTVDHLAIGRAAFNPAARPFSIITYGVGPGSGNVARFRDLSLFGQTTGATFFNEGGVSSSMTGGQIHTYGGAPALWMRGCSQWDFRTTEFHESSVKFRQDVYPVGHPLYTGWGDAPTMVFDNCSDFLFSGGNVGGNAPRAVDFNGHNQKFTFDTVEFYAQDPPPKLANGAPGPGLPYNGAFRNNGVVDGLTVRNSRVDAASYIYGATSGAIYRNLRHEGGLGTQFRSSNMVSCDAAATFEDIYLECSGLPFRANAHLGGLIRRGELRNVSLVDAQKFGVTWQTPDGRWHVDQPMLVG